VNQYQYHGNCTKQRHGYVQRMADEKSYVVNQIFL